MSAFAALDLSCDETHIEVDGARPGRLHGFDYAGDRGKVARAFVLLEEMITYKYVRAGPC